MSLEMLYIWKKRLYSIERMHVLISVCYEQVCMFECVCVLLYVCLCAPTCLIFSQTFSNFFFLILLFHSCIWSTIRTFIYIFIWTSKLILHICTFQSPYIYQYLLFFTIKNIYEYIFFAIIIFRNDQERILLIRTIFNISSFHNVKYFHYFTFFLVLFSM